MNNSNIIMYTTEDGLTKIEVTFEEDTVWLSLEQMTELFQRNKSTISRHIKNVFSEGELQQESTVAKFATVQMEGARQVSRDIEYYNLNVIISVGYRVKSLRGTQFRIWSSSVLKEYMKKGFALDDDRLKRLGGGNYFDELLARIRDIRSSEKVFWRKVMIQRQKHRYFFLNKCRTKCTGQLISIQRQKLCSSGLMQRRKIWD